jgi:predicted type IV restriction endonuclease
MDETTEPAIAIEPAAAPPAAAAVPIAPSGPKVSKWETDARDRLKVGIKKFAKPLADFIARDVNEADTRFLVTDFLCEALGYDKFADLTAEFATKTEFADYGLRVDKQLTALIEVKRVTTKLVEKHLRQVELYGANSAVEWLVLTNAAQWQVYHLDASLPLTVELVFEIDLLGPETPAKKADRLFAVTKEGMRHKIIDEVWKAKRATSPKAIARALTSEAVITAVRKELRRETDYAASDEEILGLVKATLRPECL